MPVVAAGGVADGRGLASVLALSADAAWVGTRFLLAEEAAVHAHWRSRVRAACETDTEYTTVFDGGWPGASHRVLRNSTFEAWERAGRPAAPGRPGEGDVLATAPDRSAIRRYDATPPTSGATGDIEALALYAGQSAGLVSATCPAAEIVAELTTDAAHALARITPRP